jgi:hypothetical protein
MQQKKRDEQGLYFVRKEIFIERHLEDSIVTCEVVRVTKITGSSSDDFIY